MGNLHIFLKKYLIAGWTYFPGLKNSTMHCFRGFEKALALRRHCRAPYLYFAGPSVFTVLLTFLPSQVLSVLVCFQK